MGRRKIGRLGLRNGREHIVPNHEIKTLEQKDAKSAKKIPRFMVRRSERLREGLYKKGTKRLPKEAKIIDNKSLNQLVCENLTCEHCGLRCRTGTGLSRHKTMHAHERRFWCKQCGECFTQQEEAISHAFRYCTDDSSLFPYACAKCPSLFLRSVVLQAHCAKEHDIIICRPKADLDKMQRLRERASAFIQEN